MRLSQLSLAMLVAMPEKQIKGFYLPDVMSLFGCQLVVNQNDIIEVLSGDIDQSLNVADINSRSYDLIKQAKPSSLLQYLDGCEKIVNSWPKWKIESVRDAFCIPVEIVKDDMTP